jgi:outer membrane protein TolC
MKWIWMAVLLSVPFSARATELRLQAAFESAAVRNLHVKIAQQEDLAARAAVLAQEGQFSVRLTSQVDALQRSFEGTNQGSQLRASVGLTKLFSPGTWLSFGGVASQVINRPDVPSDVLCTLDPFYCIDPAHGGFALSLQQPLLRGAGFAVNEAPVRAAHALARAADIGVEEELAAQLRDVEIEYWQWAAALRAVEIRRASLKLAEVQRKRTKELIRTGRQAKSDVLLAEQIVADREDALALAVAEVAERSERLHHLMGYALTEMPSDPQTAEAFPVAIEHVERLEELLAAAAERAYLPRRLGHERSALEHQLAAVADAALPELNAVARVELFSNDDNLGTAYADAFRAVSHVWAGGVNFSYPLGVNPAEAEAERLRARVSQRNLLLEDARRKVQQAVAAARREVALAINRIELATIATKLAEDKLRAEEARYGIGRTTMQDLRVFQEDLDEARLRKLHARVAYLAARAQLDYLLGRFLEVREIRVK